MDDTEDPDGANAEEESLTYATAGVDIEASEAATAALIGAAGGGSESDADGSEYAGLVDLGDRFLGLTTDGVGTKLLVAETLNEYSTIGIDCVAMNANDLVAAGISPVAFVDYLAVEEPNEEIAEELGAGLALGAERAGVELVGGETAVLPEVIDGLDIAGTCAGLATDEERFSGVAQPGDAIVGFRSSGIHSNGLTLAREAARREDETPAESYRNPLPTEDDRTVGEALLEPTRLYTDLLEPLREHGTHAAAHVTGGGWTNLLRMGSHRYEIDDPQPAGAIFGFVRQRGGVAPEEMHRTFNMGTGFVAALAPENANALAEETDGEVIGRIEANEDGVVAIRGLELR